MPYQYDPRGDGVFSAGGVVGDTTPAEGYGRLFGSAVDRLQGSLYGIAEGALGDTYLGRDAHDARIHNEIEAATSARKFYQGGAPQSLDEVHGMGDFGDWAISQGILVSPWLVSILVVSIVFRALYAHLVLFYRSIKQRPVSTEASSTPYAGGAKAQHDQSKAVESSPTKQLMSQLADTDEDAIWASVLSEFDNPDRRPGLWSRFYAECQGDESKAKAKYLQHRFQEISRVAQQTEAATRRTHS